MLGIFKAKRLSERCSFSGMVAVRVSNLPGHGPSSGIGIRNASKPPGQGSGRGAANRKLSTSPSFRFSKGGISAASNFLRSSSSTSPTSASFMGQNGPTRNSASNCRQSVSFQPPRWASTHIRGSGDAFQRFRLSVIRCSVLRQIRSASSGAGGLVATGGSPVGFFGMSSTGGPPVATEGGLGFRTAAIWFASSAASFGRSSGSSRQHDSSRSSSSSGNPVAATFFFQRTPGRSLVKSLMSS